MTTRSLTKKFNYSYSDGDISYRWSPDGKWILADYIGHGGWQHPDCAMVKADGSGEIVNLTESGYSEGSGKFVMKGKASSSPLTVQVTAATVAGVQSVTTT